MPDSISSAGADPLQLTAAERDRLIAEERFKAEVREQIAKANSGSKGWISRVLGSENFRWIATTLAIPLTVFVWGEFAKQEQDRARAAAAMQADAERKHAAEQAERDRKARQDIETAHRNIDLVIRLLPGLNQPEASPERLNALSVMQALEQQGQLTPTLRVALEHNIDQLRASVAPTGLVSSSDARKEVEVLSRSAPNSRAFEAGQVASPSVAIPGAKVYIQIFDDSQKKMAERLQALARDMGIAAPGVENVVETALRRSRSRPTGYADGSVLLVFKRADLDNARRLATAAEKLLGLKLSVRDRSDLPIFANVPAGQIEVWFQDPARATK